MPVQCKTNLNISIKKCKIEERTWSEEGAALVRTWCSQDGEHIFIINCIAALNVIKKEKEGKKREKEDKLAFFYNLVD